MGVLWVEDMPLGTAILRLSKMLEDVILTLLRHWHVPYSSMHCPASDQMGGAEAMAVGPSGSRTRQAPLLLKGRSASESRVVQQGIGQHEVKVVEGPAPSRGRQTTWGRSNDDDGGIEQQDVTGPPLPKPQQPMGVTDVKKGRGGHGIGWEMERAMWVTRPVPETKWITSPGFHPKRVGRGVWDEWGVSLV